MKLVAVSRVRNEADIIEPFVRHHAAYFDKIIVLDDGSCDGTYDILNSLRDEGLPLVILEAPAIGYEQSRYMTQLLRIGAEHFGGDWIAPLDADEFLEPEFGKTIAEILELQESKPLAIAWNNFEWTPEADKYCNLNPVHKLRRRLPARWDQKKVLIPASLVQETTVLAQGNHLIANDNQPIFAVPLSSISLCHYPIRSGLQYASKIAVGHLQYLSMPDWNGQAGFHYTEPFKALKTGGLDALRARMIADSREYAKEPHAHPDTTSRDEPLRYQGGALKYTATTSTFLQNILHCAEAVARDRANSERQLSNKSSEGATAHQPVGSMLRANKPTHESNEATEIRIEALQRRVRAMHREWERFADDKVVLEKRLLQMQREHAVLQEKMLFQAEQLESRTFRLSRRIVDRLVRLGLSPRILFDFFR